MFNVISLTVSAFLLSIGECDLIGYNRLGNNVESFLRFRNDVTFENNEQQIINWVLEQDAQSPSYPTISKQNHNTEKRQRRLNHYKERMSGLN